MRHFPRILLLAVLGCATLALTTFVTLAASAGNEKTPTVPTSCLLWAPVPTPDTGGHPWHIAATGPAHAWAMREDGPNQMSVLFWTGTTWEVRLTGNLSGDFASLWADDAWAISRDQGVLHWDGAHWNVSNSTLFGGQIVEVAANDVWIYAPGILEGPYSHWNGTQWEYISSPPWPPYGGFPHALAFVSPDQIWVGGGGQLDQPAILRHWNGSAWDGGLVADAKPNIPHYSSAYDNLQALGPNTIWQAGYTTQCYTTYCDHYRWSGLCSASGCTALNGPTDGHLARGGDDLWWLGGDTETTSITKHLVGTTWVDVPAPNIGRLLSLSGTGPNDAWAVSATGSLHYDGTGWTVIPLNSGADTVAADGPTSAWAWGSGLIWHTVLGTICPTATPTFTPTATATPTSTPTPHPGQFQDVPPSNTFYTYVECMGTRGIISGYPCGGPGEPCVPDTKPYFRPNNNLTRGQVSKIVVSAAGWADPVPSTQQTFEDVAPGSTFWLWIEQLAGRGVIGGYGCGGPFEPCNPPTNRPYFRPGNNLTRAQLAKIDSGVAAYTETPTSQTFEDVPPGSTFYTWVEQVAGRGIVGGYPCGGAGEPCQPPGNRPYYRPNNNVTRGQASKIVTNTFFPGCGSETPTPTPTSTVEWTPTATPTGTPGTPLPTLTGTLTGTPTGLPATATATP